MLGFKERLLILTLAVVAAGAFLFWLGAIYMSMTKPVPTQGGSYTEGVLGQPAYINPLFNQTSEADADLSRLVYDGLFTYDEHGFTRPQLAESYDVSDEGRRYTVKLRSGVKWHDGQNLTVDDAVFTYRVIQDSAYKSPLRANWQGVDIERVDDQTIAFNLRKPYFGFIDNLTVGILPKHIWENVAPEKFTLAEYNLSPIGSGPYRSFDFKKDSNGNILWYELRAFPEYYLHTPYVSKLIWHFYPDEDTLVDAYNRREVMGISNITPEKEGMLQDRKTTRVYALHQPRSFGVFFNNTKSAALAQREVRQALSQATDRQTIVDGVLSGRAVSMTSPFLPQMEGYTDISQKTGFNIDQANALLDQSGWVMKDGVREKKGMRLEFTLTTPDWPNLVKTAEVLRGQWEKVGARVNINVLGIAEFQQNVLRPREYEALLFGEESASFTTPDPYSFWHSSQKSDPGKNLALFDNKDVDTLLADARETLDADVRNEKYVQFQNIFADEVPAVFLYGSSYLYVVNDQVRGIMAEDINGPSSRLGGIADWYVETKRVRK